MTTQEGNYYFKWQDVAANGAIEAICEQTIYAATTVDAMKVFTTMHGGLQPDENGTCIVITAMSWGPA